TVSREIVPVEVDVNGMKKSIRIKVGLIGEDIVSSKTEYEDAKEVSIETGIPVKDIMAMAEDAFKKFKS
ncbi:nickel insertion protein, partial [Methanobacterium aggregans]